jgi:hypothetical protein
MLVETGGIGVASGARVGLGSPTRTTPAGSRFGPRRPSLDDRPAFGCLERLLIARRRRIPGRSPAAVFRTRA